MIITAIMARDASGVSKPRASNNGYEFELVLLTIGLVFGLIGPGAYSLDVAIGFTLPVWVFITGLVVVVLVDLVGLVISRQPAPQQSAV
jgi:putative oxidoreductase